MQQDGMELVVYLTTMIKLSAVGAIDLTFWIGADLIDLIHKLIVILNLFPSVPKLNPEIIYPVKPQATFIIC